MTPLPAVVLFPAWFITLILVAAFGAWVAWPIARDRGFEEALEPESEGEPERQRHRHRIGDPQETTLLELPRAGRLEPLPEPEQVPAPEWMFFGAQVQPQPGPAEYELLTAPVMTQATQAMTVTAATVEVEVSRETDSGFTRRMALKTAALVEGNALETDEFIKNMREESNYFRHVMLAEGPRHGKREDGTR